MSVEFVAFEERRVSGIREVMQAFLSGATLTDRPEYDTTACGGPHPRGGECGGEMALDAACQRFASTYTNIIQTALYDHALGSIGKPQPQETSTVLACCRLWSAAASSFAVEPAGGPLADVLAYSRLEARYDSAGSAHGSKAAAFLPLTDTADCRAAGTRLRQPATNGRCAHGGSPG